MGWEIELVGVATSFFSSHPARQLLIDYTALGSYFLIPLYFVLLYRLDEKATAYLTTATGILTGIIILILKNLFGRLRPSAALIEAGGYSFPSGHAALVFSLAAVLAYRWPERKYMLFSLAVLVSLTRVFLGVHYPTDIIAGGLIGFLVGKVCSGYLPEIERKVSS